MRVVVLGGTRFVGRRLVEELLQAGHTLLVVHRGVHPLDVGASGEGLHELLADRRELTSHTDAFAAFGADAVVDVSAMTDAHAATAIEALRDVGRRVAISSMDVYRAFASLWQGVATDPVPLREGSALRTTPPPDREHVATGYDYDPRSYEKLDVEQRYLAVGATVCRLPMVYGPHDYQRREEPILGRIRAGRTRIPMGAGNWLWSRGHVSELARGIRLALESEAAAGQVYNLCESSCASMRLWAEQIAGAAGWHGEFVRVADDVLPPDLDLFGALEQQWLVDASKARDHLGWVHAEPAGCVAQSVRWHLANPPARKDDFSADDRALGLAA